MAHGVDDGGEILEGLGPGGLVGGDGAVQLLGQAQNLGGDHVAPDMAAAPVGGGVGDADALNGSGIVGGHLLLLDAHGDFGMAVVLAQPGGAGAHEPIQLGFGIAHALGPLNQSLGGAPLQGHTGALLFLDVASLVQLHGGGDGAGHGNGVQTILVAEHIALIDDVQIAVAAVAAVSPQRLVLGAAHNLAVDVDYTTAGDGAAVAGAGLHQILLGQSLTGDVFTLIVVALLPVLGGESADVVDDVHENRGAQLTQARAGDGVCLQHVHGVLGGDLQSVHVGDVVQRFAGGLDHDGLQLLAAHDRADTAAACGTILVVHDGGQQYLFLTGRADVQNGSVRTVLFLQFFVHGFAHDAHILPGIQQLDLVIGDADVGPLGGLALHDDGVPAGVLELGTPDAAGVGAGDHAGQRRLGDHHVTSGGRGGRAGHGAGDVNELIGRGQGIYRGDALIVEHLGTQTTTADELVRQLQIQRLNLDFTGGQVNAGNFFVIRASHMQYLHIVSSCCSFPILSL